MEYIFGAEQPMRAAIEKGDAKGLAELILQNPGFKFQDVSIIEGIKTLYFPSESGTLLHYACRSSSRSAVIPLLLAHPGIDVNAKNSGGATPFDLACANGRTSCVREMLKDSRVKVNEPSNDGYTPLRRAARNGHLDVIKWWIASGREMDLGKPGNTDKTDAIGGAKKYGRAEVVSLLERFKKDASKTRSEVRMDLGITGQSHAPFFIFFYKINFEFSFFPIDEDFPVSTPPKLTIEQYLAFVGKYVDLLPPIQVSPPWNLPFSIIVNLFHAI